jgi:hypothetical protein
VVLAAYATFKLLSFFELTSLLATEFEFVSHLGFVFFSLSLFHSLPSALGFLQFLFSCFGHPFMLLSPLSSSVFVFFFFAFSH